MAFYIIRFKILPSGPEIPSEQLLESVKGHLAKDVVIRKSTVEPIAFGLYALIVDVQAPEGDGIVDMVEQTVATAPLVSGYEMMGVSRMSSTLKTT